MVDHRLPGEHVIDGMLFGSNVTQDIIDSVSSLEAVDGDVILASYPKTGQTWMEEVSWIVYNDADIAKASETPLHHRVPYLEFSKDGINTGLKAVLAGVRPSLMKTHLRGSAFHKQIEEGTVKIVLVIRNPKDTLVSFYKFYQMNTMLGNYSGTWDDFFELFKSKHLLYGDYFDWYESWLPYLDYPNVHLYKYEDMHNNLQSVIADLADVFGKFISADIIPSIIEHTSFEKMKMNDMTNNTKSSLFNTKISPFMRKGVVGDWKNYFTTEQSDYIDILYRDRLESKGLILEFE